MNKIIPCLTILLSMLFAVCYGAEDKTGSKSLDPKTQYALLLKADMVKEIQKRWEFCSLGSDTYQYELAQLAQKAGQNASSNKNDRNIALCKKIEDLSVLLNGIGREVEDSLNSLTLDQAMLLYGKTCALLKGVDEVRYSVLLNELFENDK